jgi:phosphohistidine phosphatase
MQLFLFRHGIAESRDAAGSDAQRALTNEGTDRTRLAAKGLARLIDPPQVILTSPLRRAVETAELLSEPLGPAAETWELLAQGEPADLHRALRWHTEPGVMLVGHEPTLSQLAELVCFGETWGRLDLKKAGCAWLEAPIGRRESGGPGQLQALLPPAALVAGAR